MEIGRKHDIKEIETALKSPDPLMRKVAKINGDKINAQLKDSWTQSARESLIKETRSGNLANTRQIRDDMIKHRGGRLGMYNKGELLTKTFSYAPGQFERIFGHE